MPSAEEADQRRRFAAVQERLVSSPLVRGGGVLVSRLISAADLVDLRADALSAHPGAMEVKVDEPGGPADRGNPDRWLESAPGGVRQEMFARSTTVLTQLTRATGLVWEPAGTGSWSYYRRAGHHLGVHRDLAVCDLAVITCVIDEGRHGPSGVLRTWPTRACEPLEAFRRDERGAADLHLTAGDTVLLLGGVVPHRVLPLSPGHVRIVAPLCYRIVARA